MRKLTWVSWGSWLGFRSDVRPTGGPDERGGCIQAAGFLHSFIFPCHAFLWARPCLGLHTRKHTDMYHALPKALIQNDLKWQVWCVWGLISLCGNSHCNCYSEAVSFLTSSAVVHEISHSARLLSWSLKQFSSNSGRIMKLTKSCDKMYKLLSKQCFLDNTMNYKLTVKWHCCYWLNSHLWRKWRWSFISRHDETVGRESVGSAWCVNDVN